MSLARSALNCCVDGAQCAVWGKVLFMPKDVTLERTGMKTANFLLRFCQSLRFVSGAE